MNDIDPKINQIDPLYPTGSVLGQNKFNKTQPRAFDQILADRIKTELSENTANLSGSLPEINGPFRAQLLTAASIDPEVLGLQMTDTLDLFERYAAFLGDPDKGLKQARNVLEQILEQTQTLTEQMNQQEESGSGPISKLKHLLNQLLTTAQVEQIKFDRGDYL
jgi:hypothetical protein